MELSRSPESPNRNLRKISLPAAIKTFYTQRGRFIRGLPGYEQVEGLFPEDHNDFFDFRYGFPKPLKESHPVNNLDQDAYERAQTHTKELLKLWLRWTMVSHSPLVPRSPLMVIRAEAEPDLGRFTRS